MLHGIRTAYLDARARRAFKRRVAAGYRVVKISFPNRIGHLIVEIDCLLKDTIMRGGDTNSFFLPDIGADFANQHVVEYFKRYITVERDRDVARYIADPAHENDEGVVATHPYAVAMYKAALGCDVYRRWGGRPALFDLSDDDKAAADAYLRSLGVPEDAWYVCMHAREGGYSPSDEAIHRFRSIDIGSFSTAVQTIVDRGGWVIRMGDATMRPFAPHPRVVDYARSPAKSAQLDTALVGGCRFYFGSASGLYSLALMFQRPCFITNMAPMGNSMGMSPRDLSIPQMIRTRSGELMPMPAVMQDECSNYRLADEFDARGLVNEPNSAEEIDDAVREMLDRLDGVAEYSAEDEARQANFHALLKPDHYSYGTGARLGRDFMRRHMPLERQSELG